MLKKYSRSIIVVFLTGLVITSCSRKKDKWLNRNWHAMTTYYNTAFNGKEAFIVGKQNVIDAYQDNYWKQLPVERLELKTAEDIYNGENSNPDFLRAEEKAAKAIQKHSMVIADNERNPQIDEAFMLLGKARYFDQRFIGALEAFNYILYKYPTSNNINNAKVWKAKVQLRLENDEGAVKSLKKMLFKQKIDLEPQELADASAILAQGYINLKHKDSAIAPIKVAIDNTKSMEEKGRYLFILGQLYNSIRERDTANIHFDRLIKLNRRVPREYLVNAYIAKARNLEIDSDDQIAFLDILNKLENNWENRPYLDRIYYEKAIFFFAADSFNLASKYYNKSLRTNSSDSYLRSLDYETLSKISFNNAEYTTAGKYMDSTLNLLDSNSKRFRVIQKKRNNLDEVIRYETVVHDNDSILKLTSMSKVNQQAFFNRYTDSLKNLKKEKLKKQKARFAKQLQNAGNLDSKSFVQGKRENEGFYFYNPSIVDNGRLQFENIYGKRQLVDNWKVSSLSGLNNIVEALEPVDEDYDINKDPQFDPQTYLSKIPTDVKVIDSLNLGLNDAYFQLGTLYKEQLREYFKASESFEAVLKNNPDEKYILPAKYNLYKIYQVNGNFSKEEQVRQDILKNHPDSRYAAIVKDPFKQVEGDESNFDKQYAKVYKKYQNEQYAQVIQDLEPMIEAYKGDDLELRLVLLKANALGKLEGVSAMKPGLTYLANTFPQSVEGKRALDLLSSTIPHLENMQFRNDTTAKARFKLVYDVADASAAKTLKEQLDQLIERRRFTQLKTSIDFYTPDTSLVVVHGMKGKDQVRAVNALLSDESLSDSVTRDGLYVSSANYRVIQGQKKLSAYKKQIESLF